MSVECILAVCSSGFSEVVEGSVMSVWIVV